MKILLGLPDVSHKRVLFVGERIKDVYHYGKLIGRPPKEPIICIERTGMEVFEGGVASASEHARSFVGSVEIFSNREIVKERYVDSNRYRKLFEVYSGMAVSEERLPPLEQYDAVIITDYGHGMMTPAMIRDIRSHSKFMAVNVQTNSGNYGFNLATKYDDVDYLCVSEMEARLSTQNRDGDISVSLLELAKIARTVVVTLGRNGATGRSSEGVFSSAAVSNKVVDTMGAGDAFFAVTACLAEETPLIDLLLVGNAAGALKAQFVGQRPITKDELLGYLNR